MIVCLNSCCDTDSFSYEVERNLFQRRLQRALDNYGGDIFSWQAMLTLQGARFPEAGDTFTYPVASSLEFLRQGLLTCNTYISALTLPESSIPSFAPTSAVSTTAPRPNRRFYLGQVMMIMMMMTHAVDRRAGHRGEMAGGYHHRRGRRVRLRPLQRLGLAVGRMDPRGIPRFPVSTIELPADRAVPHAHAPCAGSFDIKSRCGVLGT